MIKSNESVLSGVIIENETTFTIAEICQECHLPQDFLLQMIDHGMFESKLEENAAFDLIAIKRIESAFHLHRDLGINVPGIALILELKEELENLRSELKLLSHFTKS